MAMDQVDQLMRQAVARAVFPGAVLLVAFRSEVVFRAAYGQANLFTGEKMTERTIFDLASLTKPLATTLAVMNLVQSGRLSRRVQMLSDHNCICQLTLRRPATKAIASPCLTH